MRHAALAWAVGGAGLVTAQTQRSEPLTEIVSVLTGFDKALATSAEVDAKTHEKEQCTCTNEIPATEDSIAKNQKCMKNEGNTEKQQTALAGKLTKEIDRLGTKITDDTTELIALQGDMERDKAAWKKGEADLIKNIGAVESALGTLQTGSGNAKDKDKMDKLFLQTRASASQNVLRDLMSRMSPRMELSMSPSQHQAITRFLQAPSYNNYQSQTGGVIGMIGQLADTFKKDLRDGSEEFTTKFASDTERKSSLEDMNAGNKKLKETLQAKAMVAAANAEKALAAHVGCANSLVTDLKSLDDLKTGCTEQLNTYEERSTARQKEMKAIKRALAIFQTDKVRSIFAKMSAGNFLQIAKTDMVARKRYQQASEMLAAKAKSTGDKRLKMLSNEVALLAFTNPTKLAGADVFAPICKKIYEFKSMLAVEEAEWNAFVDDCQSAIDDLNDQVIVLNGTIVSTELDLADNTGKKENAERYIESLVGLIAMLQKFAGSAAEIRKEEHANFLASHENSAAAVGALAEAKRILAAEYAAFLQQDPDDDGGEKDMRGKQDGGQVINLIATIQTETETSMAIDVTAENKAQAGYSKSVADRNTELNSKLQSLEEAKTNHAELDLRIKELNDELEEHNGDLADKTESKEKKTEQCRFKMDNLDAKIKAIVAETDALDDCTKTLKCTEPDVRKAWQDA